MRIAAAAAALSSAAERLSGLVANLRLESAPAQPASAQGEQKTPAVSTRRPETEIALLPDPARA